MSWTRPGHNSVVTRFYGETNGAPLMQSTKNSNQTDTAIWSSKLQHLKAEHKLYLFTVLMLMFGAAFGGIAAEFEYRACMQTGQCLGSNVAQKRLDGIQTGAFAGMSAAVLFGLPAVFKEYLEN